MAPQFSLPIALVESNNEMLHPDVQDVTMKSFAFTLFLRILKISSYLSLSFLQKIVILINPGSSQDAWLRTPLGFMIE